MLDKPYIYSMRVWYMTRDYKELYKIITVGGEYVVVRYFDGAELFTGTMNEVQHYMNVHCLSHMDFVRGGKRGK